MENISLDYFLEIGKELNITKAAQNCHVTQQSLSAYVKKLESVYNIQLLERKPKLRLTKSGEIMFAAAVEIQKIYEQLAEQLEKVEENQKVTVAIGVHTPLTSLIGRFPLSEVTAIYPNVSISIVPGYYRDLIQMLRGNEIDMILHVGTVDRQPLEITAEFTYRQVLQDQKCIAISLSLLKQYFQDDYLEMIEKAAAGISILDFADVPIVIHPERTGMITQLKKYFAQNQKRLNIIAEGATPAIQNAFVVNGLGMSLSSMKIAALEFNNQEDIITFPLTDPEIRGHNIELVSRTESIYSSAVEYLMKWMSESMSKVL